jgi:hypothetical protein
MKGLRLPERIAIVEDVAEHGDVLYVASLPNGPIVVLRDTALMIWQEAVAPTSGDRDLADRVADLYGVPVSEIRPAVLACVEDLIARGVLEVGPPD